MSDGKKGWKVADVHKVPPSKLTFMKGWHSVRWHFGITGFGINAVTKDAGEVPIPEHNEIETGQQEVFYVIEGLVEFMLDGQAAKVPAGSFLAVEPQVNRMAKVLEGPATILIIGGKAGSHSIATWDN